MHASRGRMEIVRLEVKRDTSRFPVSPFPPIYNPIKWGFVKTIDTTLLFEFQFLSCSVENVVGDRCCAQDLGSIQFQLYSFYAYVDIEILFLILDYVEEFHGVTDLGSFLKSFGIDSFVILVFEIVKFHFLRCLVDSGIILC